MKFQLLPWYMDFHIKLTWNDMWIFKNWLKWIWLSEGVIGKKEPVLLVETIGLYHWKFLNVENVEGCSELLIFSLNTQ